MEIIDGFNKIKEEILKHISGPSEVIQIKPSLPKTKVDRISENYQIIVNSGKVINVSREEIEDSKKHVCSTVKDKIEDLL